MSEALLEGMRTVYMVPFFVSTLCVTSKFGFSSCATNRMFSTNWRSEAKHGTNTLSGILGRMTLCKTVLRFITKYP